MQIDHLAIKVDDLEAATEFYSSVLGFKVAREGKIRDHYSRHLSDGRIDISLVAYDPGADSEEARAAGPGPCIHHMGISVDDLDAWVARVRDMGCEILSEPGVIPVKFRAPGGVVAEFAPNGHYLPVAD
jgi:catechol 2,3-dioxygenase-like lactoylglutathione lyase family enzyme